MTASILILALLALFVALSVRAQRSHAAAPFAGALPADRDSERLVAELRAMSGSTADLPVHLR